MYEDDYILCIDILNFYTQNEQVVISESVQSRSRESVELARHLNFEYISLRNVHVQ